MIDLEAVEGIDFLPKKREVNMQYRSQNLLIKVASLSEELDLRFSCYAKGIVVQASSLPKLWCEDLVVDSNADYNKAQIHKSIVKDVVCGEGGKGAPWTSAARLLISMCVCVTWVARYVCCVWVCGLCWHAARGDDKGYFGGGARSGDERLPMVPESWAGLPTQRTIILGMASQPLVGGVGRVSSRAPQPSERDPCPLSTGSRRR